MTLRPLPRAFYSREVVEVAVDLLGRYLVREEIVLRITETEAYRWPGDTACHGRSGLTARNAALWGPPGRAYVYLCYGLHNMLNVVTAPDRVAAAVLIRSCEAIAGLEQVEARRGRALGRDLLTGPGKVGQALGLDTTWSHHPLHEPGGLVIARGQPPSEVLVGARVGIDYALPEHRNLPWRFAVADSSSVSHRRGLRPRR